MKKVSFIFLIIQFSILTTNAQNIDSLKQELTVTKKDTNQFKILTELYWHYINSYPDSAFPYAQKAYELSNEIKFDAGIRYSLGALSGIAQTLNNYKQALNYALMALPLFTKAKDTIGTCFALTSIGNIYSDLHDLNNSLLYYHKALNIMDAFSDTSHLIFLFHAGISGIYEQNNQFDSALYYAKKSIQLNTDYHYGLIKMAIAYFKLGKNDSALVFYKKAIPPSLIINARTDLINIYNGIAEIYKAKGKIDSATIYTKAALSYETGQHYPLGSLIAAGILVEIYESTNNKDSVLKYLKLTIALKDSLFNQEKEKLRVFENISYNEEIKNKDVQANHVRSQNNLKLSLLLAGLLAAVIIAFILVRSNKHKQKANVILQQQKEKVESTLSELKSTQQQLIQSEKMASLGELTAGIAHEIQNPLNFINNFSETNTELIEELKQEAQRGNIEEVLHIADDLTENEHKVVHHGRRADSIVKSMLEHSRASKGEQQLTNLNALIDEYLRLAYHGFRAKDKSFNAIIQTHFDEGISKVNIVPQDIGRVLLNLFNNAFYAVAEKKKQTGEGYEPRVIVSTKKLNDKMEIMVMDNGISIPQNVVNKVFQPFFTTKPTGQGTGLGLSLSYDIVKAHGGELKVESTEGEGAAFTIVMPMATLE
jgi:signal transduction histidine kinase